MKYTEYKKMEDLVLASLKYDELITIPKQVKAMESPYLAGKILKEVIEGKS